MEVFRTEVNPPKFSFDIHHGNQVVMIGSCFAENMGARLKQSKINTLINPFGILFNPFSVMNALERMLNNRLYTESDLVKTGDYFASLDHHGRFNTATEAETLLAINTELAQGREALQNANVVFVTLGSAWVYEHVASGHLVANCHKIPNKEFRKKLLTYQDVHLILRHIPPFLAASGVKAQVVFTVSPVRHWKDGATENQRSKALLIAAVNEVVQEFEQCHYFPAYEIMMDDLRDYRFYNTDMLHPTDQAIDYIWQKFQQSFFSEQTQEICASVKAVVQAASHRPVDPESNSFQRFLAKQISIIDELEKQYPDLDMSAEKKQFQHYLF
jgi:hypothetical protein